MNVSDQISTVEANLTELKGQLAEGGDVTEAIRQLAESVSLLEEMISAEGGDNVG